VVFRLTWAGMALLQLPWPVSGPGLRPAHLRSPPLAPQPPPCAAGRCPADFTGQLVQVLIAAAAYRTSKTFVLTPLLLPPHRQTSANGGPMAQLISEPLLGLPRRAAGPAADRWCCRCICHGAVEHGGWIAEPARRLGIWESPRARGPGRRQSAEPAASNRRIGQGCDHGRHPGSSSG